MAKATAKTGAKNQSAPVSVNDVPALVVTPAKPVNVLVNFKEVEGFLDLLLERYETMEFTTANIDEVQKAKAAMRALRVSAEKFDKDVKANYFNNPKKLFDTGMAPVYTKIAKIEDKCDAVLAEDDQKRIDGINFAIDAYLTEFGADGLDEMFREQFERRKAYYNKSQDEADTRNDVLAQVTDLLKRQKAYKSGQALIQKSCAVDKRLNCTMYLDQLEEGDDVATIIERIDAEIARLKEVDREAANEPTTDSETDSSQEAEGDATEAMDTEEAGETTLADEAGALDYESDLPGRTKTVLVEITYPADVADAMNKLFELLHQRGIKSKVVSSK